MRKVIDRKIYDTERAELIHSWWADQACEESLYRTPNGVYFIIGAGGASTRYGEWRNQASVTGTELRPVSEDEAVSWLEERGGTEALMERFPEWVEEA